MQQVPKQPRPIMAAAQAGGGQIDWRIPQGWTAIPAGQMRLAAFQVSQQDPSVLLTVIPLAGASGGVLANVNRWEGQIGLPSTPEADLPKIVKRIQVDGKPVDVVDLMGAATANPRQRLLGAIMPHEGRTFYFKLAGPEAIVAPQKANFDAFIASIHFDGPGGHVDRPTTAPAGQAAGGGNMPPLPDGHPPLPGAGNPQMPEGHPPIPGAAQAGAAAPVWETEITYTSPQGWTKDGPLPLRVASFQIGTGDRRAEVIVSKLPAVGSGSYAENITRWRGQVGMPPLTAGEQQTSTPIIVGGVDAALFDFTGPGDAQRAKRMQLAWVPKGQDWWFIKLIGPSDVVAGQVGNFDTFTKSIKFNERP